jgi:hypothetical protein
MSGIFIDLIRLRIRTGIWIKIDYRVGTDTPNTGCKITQK